MHPITINLAEVDDQTESFVFSKDTPDCLKVTLIWGFLDLLRNAMKEFSEASVHVQLALVRKFRKWKSYLMSTFDVVYEKDIE